MDDLTDANGNLAIEDGVKIPLVYQGAIHLGDIDLAKYKKVTITYATSAASGTICTRNGSVSESDHISAFFSNNFSETYCKKSKFMV